MKTTPKKRPSIRIHLLEVNSAIALISSVLYSSIFLLAIGILNTRYKNAQIDYVLQRAAESIHQLYSAASTGEPVYEPDERGQMAEEISRYENAFWIIYDAAGNIVDTFGEKIVLDEFVPDSPAQAPPYTLLLQGKEYRILWHRLASDSSLVLGIPANYGIKELVDSLDLHLFIIFLLPSAGLLGFYIFTFKITKPLEEIREKMKSVQDGDYETRLPEYHEREFYEISEVFNSMTSEIKFRIKEVYEKQLLLKEQELRFSQSQMNPHFIFNVLNSIALKAKLENNEELSHTISTFSRLIQAKIYRSDREEVQIKQELEYINYYLEIQKFRFEDKISYSIQIEDELLEQYIPKLCIQPLVENAVVHGLEPKDSSGSIRIRGFREGRDIILEVEDDGVGFCDDAQSLLHLSDSHSSTAHNKMALNNINSILRLRYGKEYEINISSEKNKGTTVRIHIPFITPGSQKNEEKG